LSVVELGEHGEGVEAVFAGGGQVAADGAEDLRTGQVRSPPLTFCRSLTMRMSRSAWELSNGTRRS
jgi:hypothetical protein